MAAKSARLLLEEETTLSDVEVADVHQVTEDLFVVSVKYEEVRYDDIYNVTKEIGETLLLARSGKKVRITIAQDEAGDLDNHPSVTKAEVIEE